jgi:predicted Zn-ribbon and HTH transcriptional regulator
MLSSRNAWRIGTIRAAQRLLQPLPRPSSSATTLKTSVDDIRCDPPRLIARERIRVLFWTSGGPVEKSALWLMDHEHIKPDHICLSCGQAMHLARTIPGSGGLTELRPYDCEACGVVFTESASTISRGPLTLAPERRQWFFSQ